MSDLSAYIDALAEGRRPAPFPANPEDLPILSMAIELAAQRPGEGVADEAFLKRLHQELAGEDVPRLVKVPRRRRRTFRVASLVAAAASVAGLSVLAAQGLSNTAPSPQPAVATQTAARVGTFLGGDQLVQGAIVVTKGPPTRVFMAVQAPPADGVIICRIQDTSGSVVATASLHLQNGAVVWNRSLPVGIEHLSRATLLNSSGKTLAVARFS